jgi:hypothetical protein
MKLTPLHWLWGIFAVQLMLLGAFVVFFLRLEPQCARTSHLDRELSDQMPAVQHRYATEDLPRLRNDALFLSNNSAKARVYVEDMEMDGLRGVRDVTLVVLVTTAGIGVAAFRLGRARRPDAGA